MIKRVGYSGGYPQSSGYDMKNLPDDCGYNKHFKYEVVWDKGEYTGSDDQWRQVGIPHSVLNKINTDAHRKKFKYGWTFRVEDGYKTAIISFSSKSYAFWFRLTGR